LLRNPTEKFIKKCEKQSAHLHSIIYCKNIYLLSRERQYVLIVPPLTNSVANTLQEERIRGSYGYT